MEDDGRVTRELDDALGDRLLAERRYLAGDDYTIADIAIWPWVNNLISFYQAGALVGIDDFAHVRRVLAAFLERPAVQRGLLVPAPV